MIIEEEKQLKPGDLVLVLVELVARSEANPDDWYGKTCVERLCLCPEDIHSVYQSARRKFRKGDIVRTHRGYVFFAVEDEKEDGAVSVEQSEDLVADHFANAENLTLLLAVEKREDRSAAAEGSGVTRKEVQP